MKSPFFYIFSILFFISCEKKVSVSENYLPKKIKITKISDTISQKELAKIPREIDSQEIPKRKVMPEADANFQWEANQKLEKLLKHFGKNLPDYYAGAIINDKGNLVINIKGNFNDGKKKVKAIIGDKNILFQQRKFSKKELDDLSYEIYQYKINPKNKKYSQNFNAWAVLDDKGLLEMYLVDDSPEKIKEFKENVSNSEAIIFKQSDGIIVNQ